MTEQREPNEVFTETNAEGSGAPYLRKHTRLAIEIDASLRFSSTLSFKGSTCNLSFGGALVEIENGNLENIALERVCALSMTLGHGSSPINIELNAKVVRKYEQKIALQFISTSIEDYWHFKKLMVYNSPNSEYLLAELESAPGLEVA